MRTIQMTLDDDLVSAVDEIVRKTRTTRSAFTRDALRDAVRAFKMLKLEEAHRKGYRAKPVKKGEFDVPDAWLAWGD